MLRLPPIRTGAANTPNPRPNKAVETPTDALQELRLVATRPPSQPVTAPQPPSPVKRDLLADRSDVRYRIFAKLARRDSAAAALLDRPREAGGPVRCGVLDLPTGERVTLTSHLMRGGFGKFRLGQLDSGQWVAVKVLRLHDDKIEADDAACGKTRPTRYSTWEMLDNEAKAMELAGSPFAPRDDRRIRVGNKQFWIMPLMDGTLIEVSETPRAPGVTEADHLAQRTRLTLSTAVHVLQQLESLHDDGYGHFDIKLDNIFFSAGGDVNLGDFGLSHWVHPVGNKATAVFGTIAYMPPEVARCGKYSNNADVWSLGVTLYTMMNGEFPVFVPIDPTLPTALAVRLLNNGLRDWENFYDSVDFDSVGGVDMDQFYGRTDDTSRAFARMAGASPDLAELIFHMLNPSTDRLSVVECSERVEPIARAITAVFDARSDFAEVAASNRTLRGAKHIVDSYRVVVEA